jgi:starch synthase
MNILFISPEAVPFAKTGGLADVAGALPKALAALGHTVTVVMPLYRAVRESGQPLRQTGAAITVPIGDRPLTARLVDGALPGSAVRVVLLDCPMLYDRDGLYVHPAAHKDFRDNSSRFIYLSRGALEAVEALDLAPQIVHGHDWQAGLAPVYLREMYNRRPPLRDARSVFTVHNLAFQGLFPPWHMWRTGLSRDLFNWHQLEFYGKLGFLKAGLVFGDVITTVSTRYAEEIQTKEYGCGLEGVLIERRGDLFGVVNGVDYAEWDPATDPLLPANYSATDLAGKQACKREVQAANGLPQRDVPLIGMVTRLTPQKGLDIVALALDELLALDVQLVILGTGDPQYHRLLEAAAAEHRDRLAVNLGFDNRLAHRIEAGSDLFLMPSRYEPCGLNQLYSLRYGTVPVVRAAGGLADTITDLAEPTTPDRSPNGFVFEDYNPQALLRAIERAVATYRRRDEWTRLVRNGMAQDWSWARSAREYAALYERAYDQRR